MTKLEKWIIKNWFWLSVGCVLTRKAVKYAYLERGYKAVGSEWLILPLLLFAVKISRGAIERRKHERRIMEHRQRVQRQRRSDNRFRS